MEIKGRCGLLVKESIRADSVIREGTTPGKLVLKNAGRLEEEAPRVAKCEEGRKRVHVNEPSCFMSVRENGSGKRGRGDERRKGWR